MQITDFNYKHIEQAVDLVKANYNEERLRLPMLPENIEFPDLSEFADNGLGVAAVINGTMIGFLCCYPPFDNAFGSTKARGVFSPLHGKGVVKENRADIYARMYQAAAKKWVEAGASSHAFCLYADDKTALEQFFHYGFGHRCAEAICLMEEIDAPACFGVDFIELFGDERSLVYPLNAMLDDHMAESPTFMRRKTIPEDVFAREIFESDDRYFAARSGGEIISYLKISDKGENYITFMPTMQNICGAFCLPQFRGKGIYQNLINYVIGVLKAEGYELLGVEFESINPTGYGFWTKYFIPYTTSVVRRIDEDIFEKE